MVKYRIIVYLCLLFLLGGSLWRQTNIIKNAQKELQRYYQQEIVFNGVIVSEPERRIDKTIFQIKTKGIPGKILLTTDLYPQYSYGDKLEVSGVLKQPAQFEGPSTSLRTGFNYRQYLTKDKIYSVIYYPKIDVILNVVKNPVDDNIHGFSAGSFVPLIAELRMTGMRIIFNFKDKLRRNIDSVLLPPQSSILKAVLLGDKYGISNNLKEKLNITGTRHIVAISGMHLVIMTGILFYLLLALGLWRQEAFYFILILLAGYIIMIGLPASAIRAGIMIGLLLLAQQVGRWRSAVRAVIIAALIMLLINPLLIIDVGFQLSFTAVLSIIYLKPTFDNWLKKLPNPFSLRDILTLTLAAQIGVLPILIWHFGQLSLISPLANLLIVPFLPMLMIGGLIVIFAGFIYLPLARILVWPVWLLLNMIIKIIEYLSAIPLAALQIKYFPWFFLVGWYLVLALYIKKAAS